MKLNRKHITLNGVTIHYLASAAPPTDAPTILFLHGWLLSAMAFRPSLEHLANTYHIIAPDLPGFGRSDYVSSLQDYEAFAACMRDFLQALAIRDVTPMGHSTGGGIALMMAYQYPALVRRLVLLDSSGIPLQGSLAQLMLQESLGLMAQAWTEKLNANQVPLLAAGVWNALFRFLPAYKIVAIPRLQDLRPLLPHIQTPCLIAWGEKDRTIPAAYGAELADNLPQAQLVTIKNGYHEWSALHPEILETLVSDFVR